MEERGEKNTSKKTILSAVPSGTSSGFRLPETLTTPCDASADAGGGAWPGLAEAGAGAEGVSGGGSFKARHGKTIGKP